jgi:hypothetical protein
MLQVIGGSKASKASTMHAEGPRAYFSGPHTELPQIS